MHQAIAFRIALVAAGDRGDAEEAVQDGFVKAYRALGRFREGAPFRPWLLRIVANDTTVLVPVANVDGVGLRKAITDEEVNRIFDLLSDGKIDNHQNWKGRFKDNSDKMRTGSIYDMADVLKSLTFLSKSKSLSFREKRMLDRAKALIISEISEVMQTTAQAIEDRVNEALEKCFMTKARNTQRAVARAATAKAAPAKAAARAVTPVVTKQRQARAS